MRSQSPLLVEREHVPFGRQGKGRRPRGRAPRRDRKALEHEAAEGKSARTPLIAVTGIALILGVIFVILLAITLTLYFVYGGK